ncbi:unnamed protein product [Camellia sinensis]
MRGIVACGVTFTLMAWCVQIKGPLFVSIFSPLLLVLVAIAGSLLLDEKLHLGRVEENYTTDAIKELQRIGSSDNIIAVEEEEEEEIIAEVEGVFNLDQMSSYKIVAI